MQEHRLAKGDRRLNALVHNVIWPAVAGSILWTLLHITIGPPDPGAPLWPRFFALLSVGVFLVIDWVGTEGVANTINPHYWCADLLLAPWLSVFAVATEFNTSWAVWPLGIAFGIAVIGHILGAWEPVPSAWHPWDRRAPFGWRFAFAGINGLGLGLLCAGTHLGESYAPWSTSVATASVVLAYLGVNLVAEKMASSAAGAH